MRCQFTANSSYSQGDFLSQQMLSQSSIISHGNGNSNPNIEFERVVGEELNATPSRLASLNVHPQPQFSPEELFPAGNRCPFCAFGSNHSKFLAAHIRTHTTQKTYPCTECPYIADRLSNLKTHFRRHTGEKPYRCFVCEKTFTLHQTLHAHILAIHPEYATTIVSNCLHCKSKT